MNFFANKGFRRSADIPVRSTTGQRCGARTLRSGGAGGRCCGQECPRSVLVALIFTLLALAGQALAATGAGTVTFANNSSALVTNAQTGKPAAMADGIKAALYWAPVGSNVLSQIGAPANVGIPLAGLFAAGTRATGAATAGGGLAQFQVRAWGGGYATYEQAAQHAGTLVGQSPIIQVATGNPNGGPPTPPNSLIGLRGFTLT